MVDECCVDLCVYLSHVMLNAAMSAYAQFTGQMIVVLCGQM